MTNIAQDIKFHFEKAKNPKLWDSQSIFETASILDIYECWTTLLEFLQQCKKKYPQRSLACSVFIARVYYNRLKNHDFAVAACQKMIQEFKLEFDLFYHEILKEICLDKNFVFEASLLETCAPLFSQKTCKSKAFERLLFIYDTKIGNIDKAIHTCEKVFSFDPLNIKCLFFLKAIATKEKQSEQLVEILQRLLSVFKNNPKKNQKVAFELANVYFYHFRLTQQALDTIWQYKVAESYDFRQLFKEIIGLMTLNKSNVQKLMKQINALHSDQNICEYGYILALEVFRSQDDTLMQIAADFSITLIRKDPFRYHLYEIPILYFLKTGKQQQLRDTILLLKEKLPEKDFKIQLDRIEEKLKTVP